LANQQETVLTLNKNYFLFLHKIKIIEIKYFNIEKFKIYFNIKKNV